MHHVIDCAELAAQQAGDALGEILETEGDHVIDIYPAGGTAPDISLESHVTVDAFAGSKTIHGHGVKIYTPNGGIEYQGLQHGHGKSALTIDRVSTTGGPFGLHLVNANFTTITRWSGSHHDRPITYRNEGPDGWSEHNTLTGRISNSLRGLVYETAAGARQSFKGQTVTLDVSGTPQALLVGPLANLYTSTIGIFTWAAPGDGYEAVYCIHGSIHGAELRLGIENTAPLALYLASKNGTNAQADIRLHTVHRIGDPIAIFDGPADQLPTWRFTHGNPANDNTARTQWACTDGPIHHLAGAAA